VRLEVRKIQYSILVRQAVSTELQQDTSWWRSLL